MTDVEIRFSIYHKTLKIKIGEDEYDISKNISLAVWEIGGEYKDPVSNWKIRKKLCKVTRKFLKKYDPEMNVEDIIF